MKAFTYQNLKVYRHILVMSWFVVPLAIVLFAFDDYSISNRIYAGILYIACTIPMLQLIGRPTIVPILSLVMLNYIIFFVVPIFHEKNIQIYAGIIGVDTKVIDTVMLITILAVLAIQFGFYVSERSFEKIKLPKFSLNISEVRLFYFAIISIAGGVLLALIVPIPVSLLRLVNVILSWELGVAILSLLFYRTNLSRTNKNIVIGIMCLVILNGFVSGTTQGVVQPLVIWYIGRWLALKHVPIRAFLVVALIFIILQPVKPHYRYVVWHHEGPEIGLNTTMDKAQFYLSLVYDYWLNPDSQKEYQDTTSRRASLLLKTSRVIDQTPEVVPYLEGQSILYLVYGLVPRVLWPEKPIAQQANIYFAYNYGVSYDVNTNTRYGIGHIGEAYANFGVIGIFPIFLLIGFLYSIPVYFLPGSNITRLHKKNYFLLNSSKNKSKEEGSIALEAIMLVLIVNFMIIGSTIGNVFGSFLQQMVVQVILLRIIGGKKNRVSSRMRIKRTRNGVNK